MGAVMAMTAAEGARTLERTCKPIWLALMWGK